MFRFPRQIRGFRLFQNVHKFVVGPIQPHIRSVSGAVSTCTAVDIEYSRDAETVAVITLHSLNRNIPLLCITMFLLSFDKCVCVCVCASDTA